MSMFFLEIDPSAKTLRWVRAGHEPAVFLERSGEPGGRTLQELSGEGVPLGIIEDYQYTENVRHGWESGSMIVIGTDGLHETRNADGEMFGTDRLHEIFYKHAAESAGAIQDAVIDALRGFQGDAPQEDDITLVIVKLG
jgi:sigma-B regulation protein RsbU (phosphoserine phosphatase)